MPDNITKHNEALTPEERRERGRLAGIRSGEIRRNNKILRDQLQEDMTDPALVADICRGLEDRARRGDVRAFEVIRDTIDPEARTNKGVSIYNEQPMQIRVTLDD